jgi:hypothetical protein
MITVKTPAVLSIPPLISLLDARQVPTSASLHFTFATK